MNNNVENYMNDGACWQAQAVLAYIRSLFAVVDSDATCRVGRYENCREQGYIFCVNYGMFQRNYAVYEHRNSDTLCIVSFDSQYTTDIPNKELVWAAMGDSKWNYTKGFKYGEIVECGDWILDDMSDFIESLKTTEE